MTTSNIKFRPGSKEAPTEPFKRAVTGCLRAIAKAPELEVTFAAERPGMAPGRARLPEPARKMNKRAAAIPDDHFPRGKFDEITDRADAPLADALAMLVRERLTGLAPPAAAKKIVDLWRPILEDKIGSPRRQ